MRVIRRAHHRITRRVDGLVVERNIHVVGKRAAVERDIVAIIRRNVGDHRITPGRWRRRWFSTETPLAPGAFIKIAAPVNRLAQGNTIFVRQNAAADAVADLLAIWRLL